VKKERQEKMYQFRLVRTISQRKDVFAIRYQVYAEEKGWVETNDSGLEYDNWDHFSTLFVACNGEKTVGTVRMIENSPLGFPFESSVPLPSDINPSEFYEVSRLAVIETERGQRSMILVGLVRAVWRVADRLNKKEWCAVVDQPVSRLLKLLGFKFRFEGKPVFHLGSLSVPLICTMEASRAILFNKNADKLLANHMEEAYEN